MAGATGGTPAYEFGFGQTCGSTQKPPIGFAFLGTAETVFTGSKTGDFKIWGKVLDGQNRTDVGFELINVQEPNKIDIVNARPTATVTLTPTNVAASFTVIFKVSRDDVLVGGFASGLAQEAYDDPNGFPTSLEDLNWQPPVANDAFAFNAPFICDLKSFGGPRSGWDDVDDGDFVPEKRERYQRVRVKYFNCENQEKHVYSCVYRVRFKRVNQTTVEIVHEKQQQ